MALQIKWLFFNINISPTTKHSQRNTNHDKQPPRQYTTRTYERLITNMGRAATSVFARVNQTNGVPRIPKFHEIYISIA